MALYANLRDYKFSEEVDDIRGSAIYGIDNEKLGTIDDVIFDHSSGDMRYLVVDTGGWLTSRKFLVPARLTMTSVEGDDRSYRVALNKEQISRFPEYNEKYIEDDEDFSDYERRYQDAHKLTSTGDVLHREGTANIITPTPDEMPATGRGSASASDVTPRRIAHDRPRFGATSDSENISNMPNPGYESRPLQPSSTLRPGDTSRDSGFTRGNESNEEIRREADRLAREGERRTESEPVTMNRSEFLKDGTLRSEYDAPHEDQLIDREAQHHVAPASEISGYAPDGGRRFRAFQERLRREREDILRRRKERRAA
jgi:sporulation protein YlmC with PRC-barrel domain